MKLLITTLLLAGLALPGSAGARDARSWPDEARPGPRPVVHEAHTSTHVHWCAARDFPCRPWLRGERGRYEPSTLAIYQTEPAPPNDCGPGLFEVVNTDPGEAPCFGIQRRSSRR